MLRFACGLHGDVKNTRAHVAVKTAMEKKQTRERERYIRPIGIAASEGAKVSSRQTPYLESLDPLAGSFAVDGFTGYGFTRDHESW